MAEVEEAKAERKTGLNAEEALALAADFPREAYSSVPGRGNLTSLKPAYIFERLHKVFGAGNIEVDARSEVFEVKGEAYVKVEGALHVWRDRGTDRRFTIPISGIRKFSDYAKAGMSAEDVRKSCETNAISKATFQDLLIGLDMYKGLRSGDGTLKVTDGQVASMKAEMKVWGEKSSDNAGTMKTLCKELSDELGTKVTFSSLKNASVPKLYKKWQARSAS